MANRNPLIKLRLYLSALLELPMPILLGVSLLAWIGLLFGDHTMHTAGHHSIDHTHSSMQSQAGWSWFLMLIAMMTPTLDGALRHIWVRSLTRRRLWGIFTFAAAYLS